MKPSQCTVVWMIAICFSLLAPDGMAADPPFKAEELKQFVNNSSRFFEWMNTTNHEHIMEHIMENPKFIEEFPEAVQLLRNEGWEPERFAYILNHVVIAYKKMGVGSNAGPLWERLEKTKKAVQEGSTQCEAEKEQVLSIVTEAQRELRKIDKAFAKLPAEEVRLMWFHRDELHKALYGRLPMRKRMLANPLR